MAPMVYYAEMPVDTKGVAFEPGWDDAQACWKFITR